MNVHFHVLVPYGAFDAHCARERSELAKCPVPTEHGVFIADEAPDDDDVRRIMVRAGRRVMSKLHRFFDDDDERRQRRAPCITGNEHRLRRGRRRIERFEEAVDLASSLVVVVEESRGRDRSGLGHGPRWRRP